MAGDAGLAGIDSGAFTEVSTLGGASLTSFTGGAASTGAALGAEAAALSVGTADPLAVDAFDAAIIDD